MTLDPEYTSPARVRAAIARCLLGDSEPHHIAGSGAARAAELGLGNIHLFPHQFAALRRVQTTMATFGGALLCDEVGLGKTFVALAAAQGYARPLIVAPAVLRSMWREAQQRTNVEADFLSVESLSGRPVPSAVYDFIVVDEAHHLRNATTQRYASLAQLCIPARVLLLTATPIHNVRQDITALLALVLGDRAHALTDEELAQLVVRRTVSSTAPMLSLPDVLRPQWMRPVTDEALLEDLLRIPAPIPPFGAGDAPGLVRMALVRQWVSSDGALRGALRRRLARATAMQSALEAGRYPTLDELRGWLCLDDAVQLGFPELLTTIRYDAADDIPAFLEAVQHHASALSAFLTRIAAHSHADERRVEQIRRLRRRHRGERIVAFSQYADTVETLFRLLRADGGVAALTARGGTVAGGRLSRDEVMARFAPSASGVLPAPERDDVTLLLTTDLLSEGVNLQDASVVLHLDLPWTAAKLEQRVGRVARIGSLHPRVIVYGFRPPPNAEAVLRASAIIRRKAALAQRVVGGRSVGLPSDTAPAISAVEHMERVRTILAQWRRETTPNEAHPLNDATDTIPPDNAERTLVAAVRGRVQGFAAACIVDGMPTLVASDVHHVATTTPYVLRGVIERVSDIPMSLDPEIASDAVATVSDAIHAWYEHWHAARDAGVTGVFGANSPSSAIRNAKRALLARISTYGRTTPLSRRARAAALLDEARRAVTSILPISLERALHRLAHAPPNSDSTDDWLQSIANVAPERLDAPPERSLHIAAVLLLRCETGE